MRTWKKVLSVCLVMACVCTMIITVQAAGKGYAFTYKKVTVYMDGNASKLLKKAGKPKSKTESASCAYNGMDRTYKYNDFVVKTYSNSKKGTEYINSIELLSSKVSTKEGIKIGSSKNDVIKAYGKGKDNFGVYTYTKGKTKLMITIDNNKVSGIIYVAK